MSYYLNVDYVIQSIIILSSRGYEYSYAISTPHKKSIRKITANNVLANCIHKDELPFSKISFFIVNIRFCKLYRFLLLFSMEYKQKQACKRLQRSERAQWLHFRTGKEKKVYYGI